MTTLWTVNSDEQRAIETADEADPHQISSKISVAIEQSYRNFISHVHSNGKLNKPNEYSPYNFTD